MKAESCKIGDGVYRVQHLVKPGEADLGEMTDCSSFRAARATCHRE